MHDRGRDVALLDVGDRPAARGDRRQQVFHVAADRRGDVLLQVFLGLVLGILLELVGHLAVDRLAAAGGDEVVAVDAGLQVPLSP